MMAVLIVAATLVSWVAFGGRAGLGVLVGGVIGFANYFWLDSVTKAIFRPHAFYSGGILAFKYVLRYVVIGGVLLGIYEYDLLPVEAVIGGVAAFAAAVVIQGLRSIFTSSVS